MKSGIPSIEEEPNPPLKVRAVSVKLYREVAVGEKAVLGSPFDGDSTFKRPRSGTHPVATEPKELIAMVQAYIQGNTDLGDQIREKYVIDIPSGTRVEVLAAVSTSKRVFRFAQVRVLNGPHWGKTGWTFHDNLMVPEEYVRAMEARGGRVTLEPEGPDVNARAASWLVRAKALEQVNKRGALGYYKEIVKDFPNTAQANRARERIKVLEEAK